MPIALIAIAASILLAIAYLPMSGGMNTIATIASSENAAWESLLPTTPGSELVPGVFAIVFLSEPEGFLFPHFKVEKIKSLRPMN